MLAEHKDPKKYCWFYQQIDHIRKGYLKEFIEGRNNQNNKNTQCGGRNEPIKEAPREIHKNLLRPTYW